MTTDTQRAFVYPGHPITIALEIMRTFGNYAEASAMTKHGWQAALSSSTVKGAGGAVLSGLAVLRMMHEGSSVEDAFDYATMIWKQARSGGDFTANLQEGQNEADALRDTFISEATTWIGAASRG